ncbi:MAG: GAF domain-containing protein, partial [Flavitalea sp.]
MVFKNIVNTEVVNLTNCAEEPIHIPGSIQAHGFLIHVDTKSYHIDYCSSNILNFTGITYQQTLQKKAEDIIGKIAFTLIRDYVSSAEYSSIVPVFVSIKGKDFNCTIQQEYQGLLIEFEPAGAPLMKLMDIYRQSKQVSVYTQQSITLKMLCGAVTNEIRSITGYDRVMVYRFDEMYNGEVFAESKVESIESFLNLHYPHTDIPVQARALYIKNLLRIIVDVEYVPVPIFTINDSTEKTLDLSFSSLRSVSPIHIEYLKNIGVAATLTISILHQGKLWGLIACHHYTSKFITPDIRVAALLQAQLLTSQISVQELAEEYVIAEKVNISLNHLLTQVFAVDAISLEKMIHQPELSNLTNASAVIIIIDGEIHSCGVVPTDEEIKKLSLWLHTYYGTIGFDTNKLSARYKPAKEFHKIASGILYHSLGKGPENCIIWCRTEIVQEVDWGGNPEKAIIKSEKGLSPRKSFELWKETKYGESSLWKKSELAAAANFANALQKHVYMLFLTKEELKQRTLSEKLKEANSELENMNWISSHDLKEPLRKIQMFASKIMDEKKTTTYEQFLHSVKRMNDSAARMQMLISDILTYSRVSKVEESKHPTDLNTILIEAIEECRSEIEESHAMIHFSGLPNIIGVPFLLRQLFINLL